MTWCPSVGLEARRTAVPSPSGGQSHPQTLTSLTKIFRKEFSLEFSRTVEYNKGQLGILDKVRLERAQRETQEDNIRTTSP